MTGAFVALLVTAGLIGLFTKRRKFDLVDGALPENLRKAGWANPFGDPRPIPGSVPVIAPKTRVIPVAERDERPAAKVVRIGGNHAR